MKAINSPDIEVASPPRRKSLYTAIIIMALVFYFYFGVYKIVFGGADILGGDFAFGYIAAKNFLCGRSIYLMPPGWNIYVYAPPITLFYLPFTIVTETTARVLWYLISNGLIAVCFWKVYRYGSGRGKIISAAAAAAVILFSMPLYSVLMTGNINILMLCLLSLVYSALLSGHNGLIPPVLAFMSSVKIFPAVMAGLYIRNRNFYALLYFILSLAGIAALSLSVFGVENNLIYVRQLPSYTQASGILHAMSLTFFLKLFWPGISVQTLFFASILFLAVLTALWWRASAASPSGLRSPGMDVTDLFALTAIMVLVAPSSWISYGAFYIMPFYFVIYSMLEGRRDFRGSWIFGVVFTLTCFWEIIYYHLPIPTVHHTLLQVWWEKTAHPILYPSAFSIMFLANLALFLWILCNYRALAVNAERIGIAGSELPERAVFPLKEVE